MVSQLPPKSDCRTRARRAKQAVSQLPPKSECRARADEVHTLEWTLEEESGEHTQRAVFEILEVSEFRLGDSDRRSLDAATKQVPMLAMSFIAFLGLYNHGQYLTQMMSAATTRFPLHSQVVQALMIGITATAVIATHTSPRQWSLAIAITWIVLLLILLASWIWLAN
ncbi:MAG TPA: hypothetical protein V6D17_24405 [Candidatus Obscuribacterales bacterium]